MRIFPFATTLTVALLVSACSESGVRTDVDEGPGVDTGANIDARVRLESFDDSEAFYTALRDALINQSSQYGNDGLVIDAEDDVGDTIALPTDSADAASNASDESVVADNDVTSTNVQEVGVDEQDRVKVNADGTQLFVLSSNAYGGEFLPEIDGTVDEVADNDQISDSSIIIDPWEPGTTLRILSLDDQTPDATSIIDLDVNLNGQHADGLYLYENAGQSSAIITASGSGYWAYWGDSTAFSGQQSLVTKIDVSDAANATVSETLTIDGQIISSRRIGDTLFFASRYYPRVPGPQPWELTPEDWRNTVESADLTDLMPGISRSGSDDVTALSEPASCFVAPGTENQQYYSPDIITLGVIDLNSMQLQDSECFLGSTETLYASPDAVYLATTQYDYSVGPVTTTGMAVDVELDILPTEIEWFDPRSSTDIHKFTINGNQLDYEGSGSVSGHFGWNDLQKPFRMSDSGGVLRVATMNDQQGAEHSPILLSTLESDGQGNLAMIGNLPNAEKPAHIGKPGEQLYASRFLGDRAYLVTFRQIDPLYVVDLSDPNDPELMGELEINGYSNYLHPIGDTHLLGIGKDAVPANDGFGDAGGAFEQGIKLSLFDVSNPSEPTEVDSILVGERGTNAVALNNHRAITVQAATDLHPTRVSFGINVFGDAFPAGVTSADQAWQYAQWSYTGLHGFDVTGGANASIVSRGALVVDRADGPYDYYDYSGDDRAVMVNDAVFYVNGSDVFSALWDNLAITPQAR